MRIQPGDIIIASEGSFALVLQSRAGSPTLWIWLHNGHVGTPEGCGRDYKQRLLEGRAILKPNGDVELGPPNFSAHVGQMLRRDESWDAAALAWYDERRRR